MWYNLGLLIPLGNHIGFNHSDYLCTCSVCWWSWLCFAHFSLTFQKMFCLLRVEENRDILLFFRTLRNYAQTCDQRSKTFQHFQVSRFDTRRLLNCFCVSITYGTKDVCQILVEDWQLIRWYFTRLNHILSCSSRKRIPRNVPYERERLFMFYHKEAIK